MAAKRDRILYASQSVRVNGRLVYRVQTLGSNSTFTSEDVFELGHLDKVDVVDDVPAVAVALDTNDFGGINGMAILAGMNPDRMKGAPTSSGAYLRTNASCTGSGSRYYHGLALADFTMCDGVKIVAPVQKEASLGTSDDEIQMTLYMDKVYVNSLTLTYNVGANATENYAAETDNKRWLVNSAKFVTTEEWVIASPTNSQALNIGLASGKSIPELSDCKRAFLSFTLQGKEGVEVRTKTERQGTVYPVAAAAAAGTFGYNDSTRTLTLPSDAATLWTEAIKVIAVYAADAFGDTGNNVGAGLDSTDAFNKYFESIDSSQYADIGAVRQGQVEVYLLDPDDPPANDDWDMTLRMQTVTITATPTRTPLNELGHQRPYARPMNFPVALTTNTTTTANDLELFAKIAGLTPADYEDGGDGTDIALTHLMSKENLYLVVKVYTQTDEEAGGTGMDRNSMIPGLTGEEYYDWDGAGNYTSVGCVNPNRERALKTVIVPKLKITAENFNNAAGGGRGGGAGASQEFNFKSTNELYVVKGDVHIQDVFCMERNTAADQW
jgi:hypothetical protein